MNSDWLAITEFISTKMMSEITKRYLLTPGVLFIFLFLQNGYAQDNAINTGTLYITSGTIVSDEGSFTTSASGSTENNGDFYLKGDWINNGVYTSATGKVTFWGAAAENISGSVVTVFYDCEVNKSANEVTLQINSEVSNVLTLTEKPINLNSYKIIISNPSTGGIVYSNGYLISEDADNSSKVQWNIGSTTGAHVIPFGKSDGTSIPFTLDQTAGTVGNVTTSTYPTAADNTPYPLTPDAVANVNYPTGTDNSANMVDRFWQIDKTGASGTLTITFTYADSEIPASGEGGLVSQRYYSVWEDPLPSQSDNAGANTVTTPGITNFSPWALSKPVALPIELLSFDAKLNDNRQVDIKWITASETNNDFFTVERSKDLNTIETVCMVTGAGNSSAIKVYTDMDGYPYDRISYYRLKQTDYDGKYSYSGWRTVNNNIENIFDIIHAYFNASTNECMITFTVPDNGDVELNLFNTIGGSVFSKKIYAGKGINTFTFTRSGGFSTGIYHLNVIYRNEMKSAKLMEGN